MDKSGFSQTSSVRSDGRRWGELWDCLNCSSTIYGRLLHPCWLKGVCQRQWLSGCWNTPAHSLLMTYIPMLILSCARQSVFYRCRIGCDGLLNAQRYREWILAITPSPRRSGFVLLPWSERFILYQAHPWRVLVCLASCQNLLSHGERFVKGRQLIHTVNTSPQNRIIVFWENTLFFRFQ